MNRYNGASVNLLLKNNPFTVNQLFGTESMEPPNKKPEMDLDTSGKTTLCQLPTEVLLIIFGFLTNPEDLLNLSHTTKQFTRILAPSRVEWLFGDVLKILLAREKSNDDYDFWMEQWKEVNQFRLVCKWWKRSVNRLLEKDQTHFAIDWDDEGVYLRYRMNAPCPATLGIYKDDYNDDGYEADRISTFTSYFVKQRKGDLAYNPIPSRHLHIIFEDEAPKDKWEEFLKQLLKYLQAFGRHVWYLAVSKSSYPSDEVSIYSFLTQWTKLMPNIKSLVLDFDADFTKNVKRKLAPFPHLKHLTCIQFGSGVNTAHHFLKANIHVRKLSFGGNSVHPKVMALNLTNKVDVTIRYLCLDNLPKIRRVSKNISKLTLSCMGPLRSFFLGWLTKFEDGLQYLDLDLSGVNTLSGRLNLPNLKYFRVKFREGSEYAYKYSAAIIHIVDLENLLAGLCSLQYFELEMEDIKHVKLQCEDERLEEETEEEKCLKEEGEQEKYSGEKITDDTEGKAEDYGLSKEDRDAGLVGKTSKKEKKMEFMDRFYRAQYWNYLPNLHTVKIKTIWNHWEHQRFVLERPEMPKLTFKMLRTDNS